MKTLWLRRRARNVNIVNLPSKILLHAATTVRTIPLDIFHKRGVAIRGGVNQTSDTGILVVFNKKNQKPVSSLYEILFSSFILPLFLSLNFQISK